jgi:hypothetical protein
MLAVIPTGFCEAVMISDRVRRLREAGMRPTRTTWRRA